MKETEATEAKILRNWRATSLKSLETGQLHIKDIWLFEYMRQFPYKSIPYIAIPYLPRFSRTINFRSEVRENLWERKYSSENMLNFGCV